MDTVSVAELKAKLSYYLREVREGRSFTVLSRDIPVATLGPYEPPAVDDFEIIEPTEDPALWGLIDLPPLRLYIATSQTCCGKTRCLTGTSVCRHWPEKRTCRRE